MIFERQKINGARRAFTLIELLVVIAIISVLTALLATAVFSMIGSQQGRNTKNTLRVVDKLLQERWSAVVADAKKEKPSDAVIALAGGDMERAKVIWAKVRLMEAFPISYAEVQTPTVLPIYIPAGRQKSYVAKYQTHLQLKTPGGAGESAACLLMALQTLPSGGASVEDQLNHAIATTDGVNQNMPTLIDGWTNPVAFYRFPTGNPALQAANPGAANLKNAKFADPLDSSGKLLTPNWYSSGFRPTFELHFHSVQNASGNAFYVTPVIVSAGRDGNMALLPDLNIGGPGATDNIYSFQVRGE